MPTIEIIDGVKIECYSADHLPPHVHAKYGEYESRIEIRTRTEMKGGNLPSKQLKKVVDYVKSNKDDLLDIFLKLNPNL